MILISSPNSNLSQLLRHLNHQVQQGLSLEQALARLEPLLPAHAQPQVEQLKKVLQGDVSLHATPYQDSPFYDISRLAAIVRAKGGSLPGFLERYITHSHAMEVSWRGVWDGLQSLLGYVFALLIITIFVFSILLIKVLPGFQAFYSETNTELPAFTMALISGLESFQSVWIFVLIGLIPLFWIGFKTVGCIRRLRPMPDFIQRLPGLSSIAKAHLRYLWLANAYLLNRSGLDAETSLREALQLCSSASLEETLSQPEYLDLMIALKTDALEQELEYQFERLNVAYAAALASFKTKFVAGVSTLIAILVGAAIIAVYLPIFGLGSAI
ncbi:hypothetical protein ONV78_02575 [Hahella sp. CR1]|uniref:hypothetical protein n=1 Tax=Hahella sp. CR1 TaxID=2992807 RepID=UPI002441CF4A|nr:hypothetical protein [Hahella sp. CR1]MDG9666604.1 hypothetical protein [Hahella sp. CR1]